MSWRKRTFDLFFASLLTVLLGPVLLAIALWLLLAEGRPVFYASERMKAMDQPFRLWKLRSMRPSAQAEGPPYGATSARVTRTGAWLRSCRLDELPQLWNILKGDMSFVGPRPPLRRYTEKHPEIYAKVLRSRPGVTGLATLAFHRREAALLRHCMTREETDAVYSRRCVPAKARLDLIYQRHQSVCFDFDLVMQTIGGLFARR